MSHTPERIGPVSNQQQKYFTIIDRRRLRHGSEICPCICNGVLSSVN